jgi:nucleoside-diphosphate-sugar epimerase
MKICVTGGQGYTGSKLVIELLNRGYDVLNIDASWFESEPISHPALKSLNKDIRQITSEDLIGVNAVIHLAAVANDPQSELDGKLTWEVNCLGTYNIIKESIEAKVSRFIMASSGSVYGISDEPFVHEDIKPVPISDYNKTKLVAEKIVMSFKNEISVAIVRPGTVSGSSDRMRFDVLVNALTLSAYQEGIIKIHGGEQIRPNIHIDNLIDFYIKLVSDFISFEGEVNCSNENASVLDTAKIVASVTNAKIEIEDVKDLRSYRMDNRKLKEIGFIPNKSIKDAVIDVLVHLKKKNSEIQMSNYNIKWMLDNIDKIK